MEVRMNNPIRLYMSMSLDGFIAGRTTAPDRRWDVAAGGFSDGSTIGNPTARAGRSTAN
jgi:hypothetical protein